MEGNDDELHFASRGSKKHKSYKVSTSYFNHLTLFSASSLHLHVLTNCFPQKKIYNVLSSKMRSTKKRDLCVSGHEDLNNKNEAGVKSSALVMDSNERKPATESSSDFGWELL